MVIIVEATTGAIVVAALVTAPVASSVGRELTVAAVRDEAVDLISLVVRSVPKEVAMGFVVEENWSPDGVWVTPSPGGSVVPRVVVAKVVSSGRNMQLTRPVSWRGRFGSAWPPTMCTRLQSGVWPTHCLDSE